MKSRYGDPVTMPTQSLPFPKAMLINGYAGSGGDMFPYLFKKARLGPLIGERTWGGLVGINGFHTLVDGGLISAPEAAFFDPDTNKWIAENNGIEPDIEVDARPDLIAKGQDPQLDAAINYLLGQLSKQPTKPTQVPPYPKVKTPATGGVNPLVKL